MKYFIIFLVAVAMTGCNEDGTPVTPTPMPKDPNTAPKASIDRFSAAAGNLFVRDASNGLPGANAAIDFEQQPFITEGLGPNGQVVQYYNFDVQPTTPARIYVLFRQGESSPVASQLNIIDAIPGDSTYSDFWQVVKVTVPQSYAANITTSRSEIMEAGYQMEVTNMLVNCPVVPEGSTASLRVGGGSNALFRGWYRGQVVFYFTFEEKALTTTPAGQVPLSPIYVTFNINPTEPGGGPPSGFKFEPGTMRSHNVVATLPADAGYSPLWSVNVFDNADFTTVMDLTTAQAATILGAAVANVNCPVAAIQ